jgi:hypothetical protein
VHGVRVPDTSARVPGTQAPCTKKTKAHTPDKQHTPHTTAQAHRRRPCRVFSWLSRAVPASGEGGRVARLQAAPLRAAPQPCAPARAWRRRLPGAHGRLLHRERDRRRRRAAQELLPSLSARCTASGPPRQSVPVSSRRRAGQVALRVGSRFRVQGSGFRV